MCTCMIVYVLCVLKYLAVRTNEACHGFCAFAGCAGLQKLSLDSIIKILTLLTATAVLA